MHVGREEKYVYKLSALFLMKITHATLSLRRHESEIRETYSFLGKHVTFRWSLWRSLAEQAQNVEQNIRT